MHCALVVCEDSKDWTGFYESSWQRCLKTVSPQHWDIFYPFKGQLPDPTKFDAILISGSHYSCYENNVPWFSEFFEWIRTIHSMEKPPKTIASCFGHQVVAQALGGKVARNPTNKKIFGTETITPTEHLAEKKYFNGYPSFIVLQSHSDCVISPPPRLEFQILATSKSCDIEMYCIGNQTLGIQSHPEMDAKICIEKILPKVQAEDKQATMESLNRETDHSKILEILRNFITS